MFPRTKSSNCCSGQVEFCFDYAVKNFYRKDQSFLLTEGNSSVKIAFFRKVFVKMFLWSRKMLFWHPVEYPLLKVQLFLLIQKKLKHLYFFKRLFLEKVALESYNSVLTTLPIFFCEKINKISVKCRKGSNIVQTFLKKFLQLFQ